MLTGLATAAGAPKEGPWHGAIAQMLAAVRKHLGMEIAYITEIVDGQVVFRGVDAPGFEHVMAVGQSNIAEESYCHHVLEGRLPGLMTDTALYPLAQSLAVTHSMPIRAHVGAPIYLPDGRVYGMLCCISPNADTSLSQRDLQIIRVFADMAAIQIGQTLQSEVELREIRTRIERVIERDEFTLAYQPILQLEPLRLVGFEALCRFTAEPYRAPDAWFNEAARIGRGVALELAVLKKAIAAFQVFPEDLFISFNISPETVLAGDLAALLAKGPKPRLVLELTEHTKIDDYGALHAALGPLRRAGAKLAIDDTGAGFSSLKHILHLNPDIVKLDTALTTALDSDPARRALASALVYFGRETKAQIIAEGIETESEFTALKGLGVPMGQGYLLGRPADIFSASALCKTAPGKGWRLLN
jgi:EAL domain-containing protein (putative c-di-GMP-specific phosphodiesterase class I)